MSKVVARISPEMATWLAGRLRDMPTGQVLTLSLSVADGGQAVWSLEGPEDAVLDAIEEWQNS